MSDFREALIRIAYENPGKVRDSLLPLLVEKEAKSDTIVVSRLLDTYSARLGNKSFERATPADAVEALMAYFGRTDFKIKYNFSR